MLPTNFEKIIDSLKIEFKKSENIQVIKPVTIKNEKYKHNRLIILHKGKITIQTKDKEIVLYPNRVYLLSANTTINITYGLQPIAVLTQGDRTKNINNYIRPIENNIASTSSDLLSIIDFQVKAYNSIDFFAFLELPFFEIEGNEEMDTFIKKILEENKNTKIGKVPLLDSYLVIFITMLLRHIINKKMFLQKISIKVDVLMDRRLIEIFNYIKNNIDQKLPNDDIAKQINLSKEYAGQLFRKTTGHNLQQYIKTTRINKAMELITTTNMRIQDVCKAVGIKDFAYFCRIFKNTIGFTAKQVQKRAKIK